MMYYCYLLFKRKYSNSSLMFAILSKLKAHEVKIHSVKIKSLFIDQKDNLLQIVVKNHNKKYIHVGRPQQNKIFCS